MPIFRNCISAENNNGTAHQPDGPRKTTRDLTQGGRKQCALVAEFSTIDSCSANKENGMWKVFHGKQAGTCTDMASPPNCVQAFKVFRSFVVPKDGFGYTHLKPWCLQMVRNSCDRVLLYKLMQYKYLSCSLSYFPPSLHPPLVQISSLASKTLNVCSSRNVRDQVSHPYKATGRITEN
jgi:hypothetical protein